MTTTQRDVDARLADVLDRLAGTLDRIACGAADLDHDQRARLVERLESLADELHAAGLAVGPAVDDQAEALPRLWSPG
jgi:hypothetical protein